MKYDRVRMSFLNMIYIRLFLSIYILFNTQNDPILFDLKFIIT